MSTYEQIRGARLKFLDQDPANATDGQVWYNSTTGKDRVQGVGVGAWSSSSPTLNEFSYGCSSLQAAQTAGIFSQGGPNPKNRSESYNGTGYSSEANLNTARGNGAGAGGGGTATTALCMMGDSTPSIIQNVESYDGTSWSEINDLTNARIQGAGAGSATAALYFGGSDAPAANPSNASEEYNGTSWSEGNNLSQAKRNLGGNGVQTSAIAVGGMVAPPGTIYANVEEYDGTSWTAGTAYPVAARGIAVIASSSTDAIAYGGNNSGSPFPGVTAKQYDGTAWTALSDLASTKQNSMSGGTTSAGLAVGGPGGSQISTTEEWNFSTTTITAGAWASSGSMNTSRYGVSGFGTQTSSIAANGDTYPPTSSRYTTAAEEYNGATWTNIPATGSGTAYTTASNLSPGSAGSVYGGEPVSARHEYWDGSSWSEQTDMNTPRYSGGGAGTQTSSLMMGGISPTPGNLLTEEWDGSSWTNQNNAPHNIYSAGASGTQTAAVVFGGNNPVVATTAEYDGTNWTTGGSLGTARAQLGGSGTQTNALAFGGASPPTTGLNVTEGYDGTSWSTRPTLGTARRQVGSSGHVSSASLIFGGDSGSKTGATEEFTGETTSPAPAQSLTTSS